MRKLDDVIDDYVLYALIQNDWKIQRTADSIGRSKSWLSRTVQEKRWFKALAPDGMKNPLEDVPEILPVGIEVNLPELPKPLKKPTLRYAPHDTLIKDLRDDIAFDRGIKRRPKRHSK